MFFSGYGSSVLVAQDEPDSGELKRVKYKYTAKLSIHVPMQTKPNLIDS